MNYIAEDILAHYGMPRRSGRYPWGSGEESYQHNRDFLSRVEELRKNGWTESAENIKKEFGMTTSKYRAEIGLAKSERRMYKYSRAKALKDKGLGDTEIGRIMGINESSVRSLLDEKAKTNMSKAKATADFLKKEVDKKGMIDVGAGVEGDLGISREKLNQALKILEQDGYYTFGGRVEQSSNNPGNKTTIKVLCPPDTPYKINEKGKRVSSAVYDFENIHSIKDYTSHDGGETFDKYVYPKSMDSKRIQFRYAEQGGLEKDGLIEIRRGVDDLSLGKDKYAQVRILVDNDRYLKGMAVYSDNIPDGVDIVFNTNKPVGMDIRDVMKKIKDDPENPFGSAIKAGGQSYYIDKNGERQLSLINKRASEGDWEDWSDALPAQFLSKQSLHMAKKQLNLSIIDKQAELEEILSLENPTVKKYYLNAFAEDCDAAAVHLKAAALPGQKYHVILPLPSMKETEIYAPRYENGTKLALVRYPHGGTFEIPILTVNNKHKIAKEILGTDVTDAVLINSKVAERLSGADFDGDTVMCIPTHDQYGRVRITSTKPLKGLEGFDPKTSYAYSDDDIESGKARIMKNTQIEMGEITNLINDMTLLGAPENELAAAVRHSMVVIDAEKHKLNYKQSEIDNNIRALKKNWQITVDEHGNVVKTGGASTLISRAKSEARVKKRQGSPTINIRGKEGYDPTRPEGALIYKNADDLYYPDRKYNKNNKIVTLTTAEGKKIKYDINDKNAHDEYNPIKSVDEHGNVKYTNKSGTIEYRLRTRTQPSTKMAETDDAYTLISKQGTEMEKRYADYANRMKWMANQARKELATTGKIMYSKEAKAIYAEEVKNLDAKVRLATLNKPRERQAEFKAQAEVKRQKASNPTLNKEDLKKIHQRALEKYRSEFNAISRKNRFVGLTDREWEAIQAGAISESKLKQILANTDPAILRQKAMPKSTTTLSTAKINRIQAYRQSNYTVAEIAKKLGVSTSTVSQYLKEQ